MRKGKRVRKARKGGTQERKGREICSQQPEGWMGLCSDGDLDRTVTPPSWLAAQRAAKPLLKRAYFVLRFQTLRVLRLPSLVEKSAGRSISGAAKQNFTVSPFTS